MENQIDRDRILADAVSRRDFKAWLLHPRHLCNSIAVRCSSPNNFWPKARSPRRRQDLRHRLCCRIRPDEGEGANAVFSEERHRRRAKEGREQRRNALQNIRSVGGFERRLNDLTCSGCHQTRGIGGFHFPGVDWMAAKPSNSTVVPASPHFFGDQVRRRDILNALASGKKPDYSRGFSSRPQLRGNTELAGTEYSDGWGAHCYLQRGKAAATTPVSASGPVPRGSPAR